jgi:thiamine biosynthesis lipoprotein ApbE
MTISKPNYKRAYPGLGTLVVLTLEAVSPEMDGDQAESLFTSAFAELTRLEKIFNFFDENSELSMLNRTMGVPVVVSSELGRVLQSGAKIERISSGGFRLMPGCSHPAGECYSLQFSGQSSRVSGGDDQISVKKSSCQFDLGGIAKGAIVDFVFEHLKARAPDATITVNAGGDLRTSASQLIELRVPGRDSANIERRFGVEIPAGAIATSSVDARGLNVGTASARYPDESRDQALRQGRRTASVVARTCAVADAWTKVALFSAPKLDEGSASTLETAAAELGVLAQYRFDQDGLL